MVPTEPTVWVDFQIRYGASPGLIRIDPVTFGWWDLQLLYGGRWITGSGTLEELAGWVNQKRIYRQ